MTEPTELTLMVVEPERVEGTAAEDVFEEQGPKEWLGRTFFKAKKKSVDLAVVKTELENVQQQVDSILGSIKKQDAGGMHLTDVAIGLAISAEGSIGVVTLGGEVSITLTYSRNDAQGAK